MGKNAEGRPRTSQGALKGMEGASYSHPPVLLGLVSADIKGRCR